MDQLAIVRQPGMPLWRQVAARLAEEIQARSNTRLPSEQELARRFGVNRHTVRQAIRSLAEIGLVRAEQGRGTFVAGSVVDYPISARTRFTANLRAQDREPSREFLGIEHLAADELLATSLALPVGDDVLRVRSLSLVDGVPVGIGAYHTAARRFPDAEQSFRKATSITEVLTSHGIGDYRRVSTRIHARALEPHEALLLRQPQAAPAIITEGLDQDSEGRPLAYTVAVWAADRVQLVVDS